MDNVIHLPNMHQRRMTILEFYLNDVFDGKAKFEVITDFGGVIYRTSVLHEGEKHVSEACDPLTSVRNLCWLVEGV